MRQPKVFFAIAVFVISSFLVRPAFSNELATTVMIASCSVRGLNGDPVEAAKKFPVRIQKPGDNSVQTDDDREMAFLAVTGQGLSIDTRRTFVLDLEVFEDVTTQQRIYRATTYQKVGFRAAGTYKTTGSQEFTSTDKKVRIKASDYTAKKQFDCLLE
jgi:hypothetical protein